ncbi:type IV secretory system conjugative DNA transfer family protein [Kitasatospora purpeofusca]|uniref:type IV secretory system conjugative DNA transfer family protein n=1 Tax=Kitasatospora purpeofusca TaxID=67352 RepID=UPI0035D9D6E6
MNQFDHQATDRPDDSETGPVNPRRWPAVLGAAAVPGIPLADGATQQPAPVAPSGPGVGEVFGTIGHLAWGILGAMPGGHLGGIALTAAGGTAYVLHLKGFKPKVGTVSKTGRAGLNSEGWATRKELNKALSAKALTGRTATLRPSMATVPRRRISPLQLGLRLGLDMIHKLGLYISCEDGILLFAPPRAGKTSWLGHHVIDAPGPCLVTTTRGDLYETTAGLRRTSGPVYVLNGDVSGIPNTLRWNPVDGCTDPNVAVRRAGYLLSASANGEAMENGAFWTSNAFRVLRTYLMAAAFADRTLVDVRNWVSKPANAEPLDILRANMEQVPSGWIQDLQQAVNAPEKTRDSIYLTLGMTFEFLALPQVADIVQPRPEDPRFDPWEFLQTSGTLYLIGENKPYGSIAPLFSCLTGEMFETARQMAKSMGGRLDPFLRMVLDECGIICPIPLDRWTADAGGFNIQILASVQSLSQLYQRWGRWGGQTIWQNLNKLVLPGLAVQEDQEMISAMVGTREVHAVSTSETDGGRGGHQTSSRIERVISPDKVRTLDPGTAIYFHRSTAPMMITFGAVWDRDDVKAYAKDKKRKAKAYAKALKKSGGMVVQTDLLAPPMPEYKPNVHTQPIPQQQPKQQPADPFRKVG